MDHESLVKELSLVEQLTVAERIKLAKKRRKRQINNYNDWNQLSSATSKVTEETKPKQIKFSPEVALIDAVSQGNIKEVKEILKSGTDPNLTFIDGLTALHHCCIDGHIEIVKLLLLNGANVNARDLDGWTPLHAASTCGHKEIVELLTRTGGDLLALNFDGDMPYQITDDENTLYFLEREMKNLGFSEEDAIKLREAPHTMLKRDILHAIVQGDGLDEPVTADEATFLHVAIASFYNDLVKILLENGASDCTQDKDGWRPVHVAVHWENKVALELLVTERNTDLTALTDNGDLPHDLCDNSSLKVYILRVMNHHNQNQSVVDLIEEVTTFTTSGLDTISDDDFSDDEPDYNSAMSIPIRNLENDENIKINPLYNPDANECATNVRSLVKDVKKQAPLIRSLSLEKFNSLDHDEDIDLAIFEKKESTPELKNQEDHEILNQHPKLKRTHVLISSGTKVNTSYEDTDDSTEDSFVSANDSLTSKNSLICSNEDKTVAKSNKQRNNVIPNEPEEKESNKYISQQTMVHNYDHQENARIEFPKVLEKSRDTNSEVRLTTPIIAMIKPRSKKEREGIDIISEIACTILDPADIHYITENILSDPVQPKENIHEMKVQIKSNKLEPSNTIKETSATIVVQSDDETISENESICTAVEAQNPSTKSGSSVELRSLKTDKQNRHLKSLSQDSLYALKWQRMKDREKTLSQKLQSTTDFESFRNNKISSASNEDGNSIKSNKSLESAGFDEYKIKFKYHYKQSRNEEIEPNIFTKPKKCNIM